MSYAAYRKQIVDVVAVSLQYRDMKVNNQRQKRRDMMDIEYVE